MDAEVWSVLHDGEIVAAEGTIPGELKLSVRIAYLCSHLPTQGEQIDVTLSDCVRLEYRPYKEPPVCDLAAIAILGLVMLSADLVGACVNVECADGGFGGQLLLEYSSARVATSEGRGVSESELKSAAERYWSMWQQTRGNS